MRATYNHPASDKEGPTMPLNDPSIIARHIHPTAFNEGEPWSRAVADQRQLARRKAQEIMREHPKKAFSILANYSALQKQGRAYHNPTLETRIAERKR